MAADSAAQVANLVHQVDDHWNGVAAFNNRNYDMSIYTVGADVPRVDVHWDNCQHKRSLPAGLIGSGGQFSNVPIPSDAIPAAGTDAELGVFSPSTDQLWEFWRTHQAPDGWHACWGGRIDHVSKSPGYFSGSFGATATGLPLSAGSVHVREARAGTINHAIALTVMDAAKAVSWPAQRGDGNDRAPDAIREGARLRLNPALDVNSLPLTPVARMIARAAQTYGFIVTDKGGAVAVQAENGAPYKAANGSDPWTALLGKTPSYLVMKNFPWGQLQVLPNNYGEH